MTQPPSDLRVLRFQTPPPMGQIVEVWEPMGGSQRWVVVGLSADPNAEYKLLHDDPTEPEASPSTVLVHLRPVR